MEQKSKSELNNEFIGACEKGNLEQVRYLLSSPNLQEHANIHAMDDLGLRLACLNGHLDILKYLLTSKDLKDHADIHVMDDSGFQLACLNGHLEIVKYLLTSKDLKEHANIHANNDQGLMGACANGHRNIIDFLINETNIYNIENIKRIGMGKMPEISKEYIIDMIQTRNLKNQMADEVSLKNNPIKNRLMI